MGNGIGQFGQTFFREGEIEKLQMWFMDEILISYMEDIGKKNWQKKRVIEEFNKIMRNLCEESEIKWK